VHSRHSAWLPISGIATLLGVVVVGWACVTAPPRNPENACDIFNEHVSWYRAARQTQDRWGVAPALQLAVVYQESSFNARARPPRRRILWIIPGWRLSSAYGYGQVVDATWERYRASTGRLGADRDEFRDVSDFLGWYGAELQRVALIDLDDPASFYLAYHEGPAGYRRRSFEAKPWLARVASRVAMRTRRYESQLSRCREQLDARIRTPWWWPF